MTETVKVNETQEVSVIDEKIATHKKTLDAIRTRAKELQEQFQKAQADLIAINTHANQVLGALAGLEDLRKTLKGEKSEK